MRLTTALLPVLLSWAPQEEGFSALLSLSPDLAFGDRWDYCTDPVPKISSASSACTGQPFLCAVFFFLQGVDAAGDSTVSYDVKIWSPDGSVYAEEEAIPGWDGPGGDGTNVLWSRSNLTVVFEPEDELGTYEVRLIARDEVREQEARFEASIEHVEYELTRPFDDEESLYAWIDGYYDGKEPTALVEALHDTAQLGLWKEPGSRTPLLGFFTGAFDENRWLLPHLTAGYAEADPDLQEAMQWLIANLRPQTEEFEDPLPKNAQRRINALREADRLPAGVEEAPEDAYDLDYLWGFFLATGRFQPVLQICTALDSDAADRPIDAATDTASATEAAFFLAAQWSLGANARQHALVAGYCRTMLDNDMLNDRALRELGDVLDEVD